MPGTLTWKLDAPAGTVTLVPEIATKVVPPSNETSRPVGMGPGHR
ncbi:MAG: hypothetical protein R3E48_03740 [Burkholderiaceae bacterium]